MSFIGYKTQQMAGKIESMSQVKQLLLLHQQGNKMKYIARSMGISKNTVKSYLAVIGNYNYIVFGNQEYIEIGNKECRALWINLTLYCTETVFV